MTTWLTRSERAVTFGRIVFGIGKRNSPTVHTTKRIVNANEIHSAARWKRPQLTVWEHKRSFSASAVGGNKALNNSTVKEVREVGDEVVDDRSERQKRRERTDRRNLMNDKLGVNLGKIKVAIIGRPNVGKSTLFNRLTYKKEAIVSNIPGTTRDRKEGDGKLGSLEFRLIDTGGFENINSKSKSPTELLAPEHGPMLVQAMHEQTRFALLDADVVLFVVDAKEGITQDDINLSRWIKKNAGRDKVPLEELTQTIDFLEEVHNVPKHWFENRFVLVANKAEGLGDAFSWGNSDLRWATFLQECYRLGFGDPIPISAEHNQAIGDLHNALLPYAIIQGKRNETLAETEIASTHVPENLPKGRWVFEHNPEQPITISLVGRPNVGKSTLVNVLLGEKRCIAGPVPGLTRDSIQIDWEFQGRKLRLVDTAGIRRRTKLYGGLSSAMASAERFAGGVETSSVKERKNDAMLEDISIQSSLRSLDFSQVVVFVIDITTQQNDMDAAGPLTRHDLSIISRVLDEGRGLVIVANKCDLTNKYWMEEKGSTVIKYVRHQIEESIPLAKGVPIIPLSAEQAQNVDVLIPTVLQTYDKWCLRIPTPKLNEWLQEAQLKQAPPPKRGATYRKKKVVSGPLRIKYVTQPSTRPPSFVLFVNRFNPKRNVLPDDYTRYLLHSIRRKFSLDGIPVRFSVRGSTKLSRRRPRTSGSAPSSSKQSR